MNILGLSGSLRQHSTNTALLLTAQALATPYFSFHLPNLIGSLPLFNPDMEPTEHPAVVRWAATVKAADGLIISTPEYARGYPGALKNALDWLVQGDSFVRKPFVFLIASERAKLSHETLTTVLETMSGVHASALNTVVPLLGSSLTATDIQANPEWRGNIETLLGEFKTFIETLADSA